MIEPDEHATAPDKTTRNPILWGAYLACSWTWCIGMFLPVLLMRDFGWAGFLVFAVPNVLGAAAMGWVLTSRKQSESMVSRHPRAVWWFSAVTIAYHAFWIMWILNTLRWALPMPREYLYGVAAIVIAFSLVAQRSTYFNRVPHLAAVLWVFSALVLVSAFALPDLGFAAAQLHRNRPSSPDAVWMLPVSAFGFLLCPYLDVTFHHARQSLGSRRNGRIGFTLGFCFFFAAMIVLTSRYAGVLLDALEGRPVNPTQTVWLGAAIMSHILCQWVFTVRVHLQQIKTIPTASKDKNPDFPLDQRVLWGVALLAGLIGFLAIKLPAHAGLSGGEIVYRVFLGAYGLVFPTYVLYRVVIGRRTDNPMSLTAMWAAIIIAAPMFWMGFMERQSIWLAPGVGVVLLIAGIGAINRKQGLTSPATGERIG